MSRVRTYGSVIGSAVVPTTTGASGVFDITTAAVETRSNTWVGTTPVTTISLPTSQQTGGFVDTYQSTYFNYYGIRAQRNFFEDGVFYVTETLHSGTTGVTSTSIEGTASTRNGTLVAVLGQRTSVPYQPGVYLYKQKSNFGYSQIGFYSLTSLNAINIAEATIAFNPSGSLLAARGSFDGSTYSVIIFNTSAETLSYVTTLTPGGTTYCLDWSSDGQYLAVGTSVSPYLNIYSVSGTTFTQVSGTTITPSTGGVRSIKFAPTNNDFVLTNYNNPANLRTYNITGNTVTLLSNLSYPASLPVNGPVSSLTWSSATLFAGCYDSTLTTYYPVFFSKSGNTVTPLGQQSTLGNPDKISFSPGGEYVFVGYANMPGNIYAMSGSTIGNMCWPTGSINGSTYKSVTWFKR